MILFSPILLSLVAPLFPHHNGSEARLPEADVDLHHVHVPSENWSQREHGQVRDGVEPEIQMKALQWQARLDSIGDRRYSSVSDPDFVSHTPVSSQINSCFDEGD